MLAQPLPDGRVPVLLSAHDEQLIGQDAWAILDYVNRLGADHDPTVEVASTLLRLRRVRRHRAVVRAADRAELVAALSALAHDEEHPLISRSSKSVAPSVAFVFPGQGNQWQSMGSDAYRRLAAYRAEADRCAAAFVAAGFPSPLPYLQGDQEQDWSRTEIQGAQFIHAVSLASQWKFCGVLPAITVGHSLGEVAAAYVAEKISLADAAALVGARATVVDRLTGHYAMVVLGLSLDEAQALIAETPGWLEISAVNGPSATVVSGDRDAVLAVAELAQARGVFAQQLIVDYPGHTSALRPLGAELVALQPRSAFRDGPMAFIGSAVGAEVGSDVDFSRYWYESLCSTVRFDRAVVAAQKCGADAFIEMSAHPSLLYPLNELIGDDSAVILGSGHRDGSITDVLSANIAAAAIADPHYPWADALPGELRPPLRGFPNAPMRAVHLWAAPEPVTTTFAEANDSLTIAVEDWQPTDVPTPAAATPVRHRDRRRHHADAAAERRRVNPPRIRRSAATRSGNRCGGGACARPARPDGSGGADRRPRTTWDCRTTTRSSAHDAAPCGCSPPAANESCPAIRPPGPPRRRWPPCTAASASNSVTRRSAASTCRWARSTSRPRPPRSTCCSATPACWRCAPTAATPDRAATPGPCASTASRRPRGRSTRPRWRTW